MSYPSHLSYLWRDSFPSNGGLLYAAALMAAGWDGAPAGVQTPGFPQDGSWAVKWEGISPAP